MNKFITLTRSDNNKKILINPAHIVMIEVSNYNENNTAISLINENKHWLYVKETMEEIKIKILDTDFTKW